MEKAEHEAVGKPTLIFPAGMPRSLEYLQNCLRDGLPVIGASSLEYDVSREKYPSWLFLPYITQPDSYGSPVHQDEVILDLANNKIILKSDRSVRWNLSELVLDEEGKYLF